MPQVCSHCSRPSPADAQYCYYDGNVLHGHKGAINPGTAPFPTPFVFPSGHRCQNFDQLALGCQQRWGEAVDLLKQGFLEAFLGGLGRADLALAARTAANFPDRDRGLDQLLSKLPTRSLPDPKVKVDPAEVNLGTARPGVGQTLALHLENQGGRLLYGAVVSNAPWLTFGDAPGHPQKIFQCTDAATLVVNLRGDLLRAGPKPMEARLTVESNGGSVAVPVKVEVQVKPFPEGALAGATSPREIAVKAKKSAREAAALFEAGAVQRWYKDNGWTYPVDGNAASGVAAVQQFYEALGLVKPPKVEVTQPEVRMQGPAGERLEHSFLVQTTEKRHVYAHALPSHPWLTVTTAQAGSTAVKVTVAAVAPSAGEPMQGRVTVTANGNQRFAIPVTVQGTTYAVGVATAARAVAAAPADTAVAARGLLTGAPVVVLPETAVAAHATQTHRDTFVDDGASPRRRDGGYAGEHRSRGGLPLVVHLLPGIVLGLLLAGLLVKDLFVPKREPDPQQRTEVKIEGNDDGQQGDGGGGPAVGEAPVDPAPRITYAYAPNVRRFGVTVAQTGKRLTYSGNGGTNTTVVKIGPFTREFGGFQGRWVLQEPAPVIIAHQNAPPKTSSKSIWLDTSNVQVTQALDIVPSKQPVEIQPGVHRRLLDTCLIAYQLENKGDQAQSVGLRLQLDTLIGNNDGVPFTVPGRPGLVNTFDDFRRGAGLFPDFIQALEVPNLQNPGTVAHLTVNAGSGLEPPDRISLTRWPGGNLNWEIPVGHMGADSAVVLYWSEKELRPGEKRSLGFAYGLGAVSSDAGQGQGKLGVTLSGSFDPGERFTVTAYVSNPVQGQTVRLKLPGGLTLVEGAETQQVQPAPAGGSSVITWRVSVQRPGQFPLAVESSTGISQRRTITVTRTEPGKRPTNPDNIFR